MTQEAMEEKALPDELSKGEFSCIDKINPDEPVFVLRGQDQLAVHVLTNWIHRAEDKGVNPAKVADARRLLEKFKQYGPKKLPD